MLTWQQGSGHRLQCRQSTKCQRGNNGFVTELVLEAMRSFGSFDVRDFAPLVSGGSGLPSMLDHVDFAGVATIYFLHFVLCVDASPEGARVDAAAAQTILTSPESRLPVCISCTPALRRRVPGGRPCNAAAAQTFSTLLESRLPVCTSYTLVCASARPRRTPVWCSTCNQLPWQSYTRELPSGSNFLRTRTCWGSRRCARSSRRSPRESSSTVN